MLLLQLAISTELLPEQEDFARINNWHVILLFLKLSDYLIFHPLIIRHDKFVFTIVKLTKKAGLGRQSAHHQFLVLSIRVTITVIYCTENLVSFTSISDTRCCLRCDLNLLSLLIVI